jgi:hypothetical protein
MAARLMQGWESSVHSLENLTLSQRDLLRKREKMRKQLAPSSDVNPTAWRFVVVVGPAGSGKSAFIKAELERLGYQGMPGRCKWTRAAVSVHVAFVHMALVMVDRRPARIVVIVVTASVQNVHGQKQLISSLQQPQGLLRCHSASSSCIAPIEACVHLPPCHSWQCAAWPSIRHWGETPPAAIEQLSEYVLPAPAHCVGRTAWATWNGQRFTGPAT